MLRACANEQKKEKFISVLIVQDKYLLPTMKISLSLFWYREYKMQKKKYFVILKREIKFYSPLCGYGEMIVF